MDKTQENLLVEAYRAGLRMGFQGGLWVAAVTYSTLAENVAFDQGIILGRALALGNLPSNL